MWEIILAVVGVIVGAGGVYGAQKVRQNDSVKKADQLIAQAQKEAAEITLNATNNAKKETDDMRREVKKSEDKVTQREANIVSKIDELDKRSEKLRQSETELEDLKKEIREVRDRQQEKLEKIANLSKQDAKDHLLKMTKKDVSKDLTGLVTKLQKDAEATAETQAETLLVTAMERMSSDVVAERVITAVPLPNEDMKGRLIGKEGRNIQALQMATGVDILVDDTPGMIVLSSFDPIRRQVARLAVEALLKDGRINPARIEEVVAKAETNLDKEVVKAGEDATREVGLTGFIPNEMVHLLGELKFRTSYGQNVLQHSKEMAQIAGVIASEVGADMRIAKTGTLLHDIGKAVTHRIEGKHAEIGAELARKYGMDERVVNAIEAHHEDVEATTPEAIIVRICDALSAARPGARNISAENFIERMKELENIATSFDGISKAYALSAGREVRVIVRPEKVDDLSSLQLARDIANKIEATMQYPGTIKVNVIRETRAIEYAK
ncbi:MAG: ribonuclease Y [Candidatus Nanoperiomorbaceae bacterium]